MRSNLETKGRVEARKDSPWAAQTHCIVVAAMQKPERKMTGSCDGAICTRLGALAIFVKAREHFKVTSTTLRAASMYWAR